MARRICRLIGGLMAVLAALALVVPATSGQAQEARAESAYFEATGHNVSGSFLAHWQEHGGLRIFGYPISAEFAQDGRATQYFRARRVPALS